MKDNKIKAVSKPSSNGHVNDIFSKEYITELKKCGNHELGRLIRKQKDNRHVVFILENLGYLPKNFDGSFLIPLLKHKYGKIRLLAARNIAKLTNSDNTEILLQTYRKETDTWDTMMP